MIVKIGHAADTDRGLIISNWYNKPWSFVLRAKDARTGAKMAEICLAIIGSGRVRYSQNKRNSLFKELQAHGFDISQIAPCYADCSSLMAVCAYMAGIPLDLDGKNAPTTRTMRKAFTATGLFDVLEDYDHTHKDTELEVGDILDVPDSHTVMVLDNGRKGPQYKAGQTYTTRVNLKVRSGPSIAAPQKLREDLTADGQKHSLDKRMAVLKAGTKVTCKEVSQEGEVRTWLRSPSGWMCAVEEGNIYID